MKKILFVLTILISQFTLLYSQVSQEWIRKYNGPGAGEDAGVKIAVDAAGNIYVTGYSTGSGSGHDYTTIKYNSSGVHQWTMRYNGPGNALDEASDIAVDAGGNVYVTGRSAAGATEYTYDYATIKYSPSGAELWVARYNGPAGQQDEATSITLDDEGNVYVTGQSGHPALDSDIGTVKYNSSGVQQWAVEYDLTGNWDTGNDICVDDLNNVYVTGFHSTDWGTAYLDFATVKYNSQGVQQWSAGYNGTAGNSDIAVAMGLDAAGNVYITGYSTGTVYDLVTIKYNPAGTSQWTKVYSSASPSIDVPNEIKVDPAGNVYITGAISFDYGTIKYNTSGDQQWVARYDFNGNFDFASSIAIDASGNSYVTGSSAKAQSESSNDFATIKYNPAGVQQWTQRYEGPAGWDEGNGIAVDNIGNVYVTGFSNENSGVNDFSTIKYSQFVGVSQVSNEIPKSYRLFQNYPNPFNPSTKVRFQVPQSDHIRVAVFDAIGKEVLTLVNEQLAAGIYELTVDGSDLPSGLYFYRLVSSGFSDTKKMILIK
jgi:uncharacterized delta-60 repeat protein